MLDDEFKIKVVADITCDINGSIPSTKRSSSIDDPVYDYNANDDKVYQPFTNEHYITVMAVDNLPNELPIDASKYFSNKLSTEVLPNYMKNDPEGIIARATITKNGQLTANYKYLQDYVGSLE
jgi:alanine dehydrogenase